MMVIKYLQQYCNWTKTKKSVINTIIMLTSHLNFLHLLPSFISLGNNNKKRTKKKRTIILHLVFLQPHKHLLIVGFELLQVLLCFSLWKKPLYNLFNVRHASCVLDFVHGFLISGYLALLFLSWKHCFLLHWKNKVLISFIFISPFFVWLDRRNAHN